MIYTVTFNPALDYVVKMDSLELGMVNRSKSEAIFYGGKGINVSTVLKNIGVDSVALGFVAGFTGKEIEDGVKAMGVKTDFIQLKNGLSRINVKIKAEQETEINGQGPDIKKDELQQMFDKLQSGDCLILAGTIPASLPSDIYEQIMEKLMNRNIDIVVDATKDLLLNVLKFHPFLIKPNNHELGEMFGVVLKSDDEIVEYAKKLQVMGARNVLISMAGDGAILITETGEVHKIGVPKGTVVNSVGAGDSMVAGLIYGIEKGLSQAETLAFASAVSAFAVSQSNVGVSDIALLEPILANVKISVIEG